MRQKSPFRRLPGSIHGNSGYPIRKVDLLLIDSMIETLRLELAHLELIIAEFEELAVENGVPRAKGTSGRSCTPPERQTTKDADPSGSRSSRHGARRTATSSI